MFPRHETILHILSYVQPWKCQSVYPEMFPAVTGQFCNSCVVVFALL